jgi:glycosyltransferase involved in cell wall biosynthesis
MNWSARCAIVIPCLNEEAAIADVVSAAREHLQTVIVVDDGSTDETSNKAKASGAVVLRHETPRGKGVALQTGWGHAREQGFEWALCMDGDGQHSPDDIPQFLRCADQTGAELVVGNRMSDPHQMPRLRRFVNRWMSARISKLTGRHLPDSQCGFRLMNLVTWASLSISAKRFEIESDTLLAFAKQGGRIEFVPIQVIYKTEQSKIHPVRDTVRWFRWWKKAGKTDRPSADILERSNVE